MSSEPPRHVVDLGIRVLPVEATCGDGVGGCERLLLDEAVECRLDLLWWRVPALDELPIFVANEVDGVHGSVFIADQVSNDGLERSCNATGECWRNLALLV